MQEGLKSFMKHIGGIKPPYGDLMRNGIPGGGMANVAADQTNALYHAAHDFAVAYQTSPVDMGRLQTLANDVEALLMSVTTMGVIDAGRSDELVAMLQLLVEAKFSQSPA